MKLMYKKIIAGGIFSLLLIAVYKSFQNKTKTAHVSQQYWGSVKANQTHLKGSPDFNSNTKLIINKINVPVYIMQCDKRWCKVKLINNDIGWIAKTSISRLNTSIVVTKSELYKNMNDVSKIAAILHPFVVVKNLIRQKDWCKIEKNKISGWMRCKNLAGGHYAR